MWKFICPKMFLPGLLKSLDKRLSVPLQMAGTVIVFGANLFPTILLLSGNGVKLVSDGRKRRLEWNPLFVYLQ